MRTVRRNLPYTKQLVLYALYDVLDSKKSSASAETAHVPLFLAVTLPRCTRFCFD